MFGGSSRTRNPLHRHEKPVDRMVGWEPMRKPVALRQALIAEAAEATGTPPWRVRLTG